MIENYPNLQSIIVKKNSLKNLNSLKICNCENLKIIKTGINYGEMTEKQKENRLGYIDSVNENSSSVWKNVDNILDVEKKRAERFYDPMISLRMSYRGDIDIHALEEIDCSHLEKEEETFLQSQSQSQSQSQYDI